MLKKILTYFEMLIVPHALHCVDSCIFVFTSFDTVWHTVLVSVPPLPSPPSPKIFFIRFSFFFKIHLLESSRSCRVTPPPPPPPPHPPLSPNFLSDLVLAPSSLHQPPPDKGHTVREYYWATGVYCPACGALVELWLTHDLSLWLWLSLWSWEPKFMRDTPSHFALSFNVV